MNDETYDADAAASEYHRPVATVTLTGRQLTAVHALLELVHYDDLAQSWLDMLPVDLKPVGKR